MEDSKIYALAVRKYGNDNIAVVYDPMTDDFSFFDLSKTNSRDAEIGYVSEGMHEGWYSGVIEVDNEYVHYVFASWEAVADMIEENGWIFVSDCDDLKK